MANFETAHRISAVINAIVHCTGSSINSHPLLGIQRSYRAPPYLGMGFLVHYLNLSGCHI